MRSHKKQSPSYDIDTDQLLVDRQNQLGQGNYAVVYLGKYKDITVAIKELGTSSLSPEEHKEAAFTEANIMQMIAEAQAADEEKGKNIVRFYGFSSQISPEKYQFVTEYVNNGSLRSWIYSTTTIDWNIAYPIINDIAKGLNFIHQLNIIHRDIKPANILLTQDMRAKLTDFGLSEVKKDKASYVGTPLYTAPEILMMLPYTEKIDIYSFSMLLWEMAAKEEPFFGLKSLPLIIKRVCTKNKRMPIPSDCPEKIGLMMNWCWQPIPDNRPSAEDLLDELKTDINIASPRLFQNAPMKIEAAAPLPESTSLSQHSMFNSNQKNVETDGAAEKNIRKYCTII